MNRSMTSLGFSLFALVSLLLAAGCLTITVDKEDCCAGAPTSGESDSPGDDNLTVSSTDSTVAPQKGPPKKPIYVTPDPVSGDIHWKIDGLAADPISTSDDNDEINALALTDIYEFKIEITVGGDTKKGTVDYFRGEFENPAFPNDPTKRRVLIVHRLNNPGEFQYTMKLADGTKVRTLQPVTRASNQHWREDLCQKLKAAEVTYRDPFDGQKWKTGNIPATGKILFYAKD